MEVEPKGPKVFVNNTVSCYARTPADIEHAVLWATARDYSYIAVSFTRLGEREKLGIGEVTPRVWEVRWSSQVSADQRDMCEQGCASANERLAARSDEYRELALAAAVLRLSLRLPEVTATDDDLDRQRELMTAAFDRWRKAAAFLRQP